MQSYRKSIRSHFLFYERLYHETLLCTLSNFVEGQVTDTGRKNGFAQIRTRQRKYITKTEKCKSGANMVNAIFA